MSRRAKVVIVAGPNGAGKSTSAAWLLQGALEVSEFVNAYDIARGLSAFEPANTAIEAGRTMLKRLRQLASRKVDFAFETTLATRSFVKWVGDLRCEGYEMNLVFLWLPSAEFAVERVRERVAAGGHDVLEEAIRRRYAAGLRNFFSLYRPMASKWCMYNNAAIGGPALIAHGEFDENETVLLPDTWQLVKEQVEHVR